MRDKNKATQASELKKTFSRNADEIKCFIDYRVEYSNDSCKRISDLMDFLDLHYEMMEDLDDMIDFYEKEDDKVTTREVINLMKAAAHMLITSWRLRVYAHLYL